MTGNRRLAGVLIALVLLGGTAAALKQIVADPAPSKRASGRAPAHWRIGNRPEDA